MKKERPTCKHIKKDGQRCKRTILFEDGFCISHSQTEKAKEGKKQPYKKRQTAKKFRLPSKSPIEQIRKFCLECCCDSWKTIIFCSAVDCPLWFLRFGQQPKAYVNEKGEEHARLFDKENFQHGACYDPDIVVEEMKV